MNRHSRQRGVSVLTALFLIVGLGLMGALLTRLMVHSSTIGISEWYSAQAFHAAEAGIDWAAYQIVNGGNCSGGASLDNGTSFSVTCSSTGDLGNGHRLYTLTSTGTRNGPHGPVTHRIIVQYMP